MYQSQYFVNSSINKASHHLASKHDFHQFPPRFQGPHATTNASGANHLSPVAWRMWMWQWAKTGDTPALHHMSKWTTPIAVRPMGEMKKKKHAKSFFHVKNIFQYHKSNINHGQSWPTCEDLQLLDTFLWISVSFYFATPPPKKKKTEKNPAKHLSSAGDDFDSGPSQLRIRTSICSMTSWFSAWRESMFSRFEPFRSIFEKQPVNLEMGVFKKKWVEKKTIFAPNSQIFWVKKIKASSRLRGGHSLISVSFE